MTSKNSKSTKGRIISSAWELFYEQGYDATTVDEIVELSETSKGSFYHYFKGKDALLGSLSFVFDEKYDELKTRLDLADDFIDQLMFLNHELFVMIEDSISVDLLSRLFAAQLLNKSDSNLLDQDRTYYKIIRAIVKNGRAKGDLRDDVSVNEICKAYAVMERGMMYDWCICSGSYSLAQYSNRVLREFLENYRLA